MLAGRYIVHITSPPDARYSPLQTLQGRQWHEVRALVLPAIAESAGADAIQPPQVQ